MKINELWWREKEKNLFHKRIGDIMPVAKCNNDIKLCFICLPEEKISKFAKCKKCKEIENNATT